MNIPHKPTPEGFKIWAVAAAGYLLGWLFHAKGDKRGPVEIDPVWLDKGFTPTEAVPLTLLLQKDREGRRIYPTNAHVAWFDNLFTSIPLLDALRDAGMGAAGTVRTTTTKRERLLDTPQKFQGTTAAEPHKGQQTAIPDQPHLQIDARKASQSTSKRRQLARKDREKFSERLMGIKLTHNNQLEWGSCYWDLSAKETVLQAAWKDAQVVLFASTVANPAETVQRLRRRPAATASNAATTRRMFGSEPTKIMPIPTWIDDYNHSMNGVDRSVQLSKPYDTQRVKRKTWRPLFYFLLNVSLNNSYLLSAFRRESPRGGHKRYVESLWLSLLEKSGRPYGNNGPKRPRSESPIPESLDPLLFFSMAPPGCGPNVSVLTPIVPQAAPAMLVDHVLKKLFVEAKACVSCKKSGRAQASGHTSEAGRQPLGELSLNVKRRVGYRRALRSQYGCAVCRIPLCRASEACLAEHITSERLKVSEKDLSRSSTIR